jgi:hypothetical protein
MARRPNNRAATKVFRKKPGKHSVLLGMVLVLFIALVYHALTRQPSIVNGVAREELGGIHVEGVGGDAELNKQKNRLSPPATVEDVAPSQIVAIKDGILLEAGKRHRASWNSDARGYLSQMEGRGMRVTGYIIAAKESGPESCNGYIDSLRDYHIWIGDSASANKSSSLVVEVTPRWKEVYPEWRLRTFTALARQHARVRVTGWLMWDEEHASEIEHSRASCWEVHPITKFEVWSGGQWRELSGEFALN